MRLTSRAPTKDEQEIVQIGMDALADYAQSIDMPLTVFMSAVQAFSVKNLASMDPTSRKNCLADMEKVASDAYEIRVQNDPTFEPIKRSH